MADRSCACPAGWILTGTRSGDLDPGILLYLLRERGFTTDTLEQLVDRQSGLLGISGCNSDMRSLQNAAPSNGDARLVIAMFRHGLGKSIATMAQSLGGVGMLVFTGGIGEHDASVRATVDNSLS